MFRGQPMRTWVGHKADVLDVCWSRSQFMLSASMDKTVRLWHISMDECLRVFRLATLLGGSPMRCPPCSLLAVPSAWWYPFRAVTDVNRVTLTLRGPSDVLSQLRPSKENPKQVVSSC